LLRNILHTTLDAPAPGPRRVDVPGHFLGVAAEREMMAAVANLRERAATLSTTPM
jgi:hypothetical protein